MTWFYRLFGSGVRTVRAARPEPTHEVLSDAAIRRWHGSDWRPAALIEAKARGVAGELG